MNSKSEYNRCEIARLVLGEGGGGVDIGEQEEAKEQQIRDWINARAGDKVRPEVKNKNEKYKKSKRKATKTKETEDVKEDDLKKKEEDDRPAKKRKFKHKVLDKGWGCIAKVVTNLTENVAYVP